LEGRLLSSQSQQSKFFKSSNWPKKMALLKVTF